MTLFAPLLCLHGANEVLDLPRTLVGSQTPTSSPSSCLASTTEEQPVSSDCLFRHLTPHIDIVNRDPTRRGQRGRKFCDWNAPADDFIKKPFSQRLLVERVKAVLRRAHPREAANTPEETAKILERGKLKIDPERHSCLWDGKQVMLTVTEFLILQALAQRPGVVKSRDALMDAAYDDQVYVDDRTIDSHIKRLRQKFKVVDNNFDVVETLYGIGYRYKESR